MSGTSRKSSDLSIIIVSYNTSDDLQACLSSLSTLKAAAETIVVDNASTDGTVEMLREKFPGVVVLENKVNIGFGKANNQGMRLARGRYLLLLNSDTVARPGSIEKLLEFASKHPEAGLVGPRLLNGDGTVQPSVSRYPDLKYVFIRMFGLRKLFPLGAARALAARGLLGSLVKSYFEAGTDKAAEVDFVSGACMLIPVETIKSVGMFDENFFMYVEDFDLCKRIRESGRKIYFYPGSVIVHYVGKSSGNTFRELSIFSYESLYYYFRKHHGRARELAVRGICFSALALKAALLLTMRPIETLRGRNSVFNSYRKVLKRTLTL